MLSSSKHQQISALPLGTLTIGNTAFLLDALTIVTVSLAILTAANALGFMTLFIPWILFLRVVAYHFLPDEERLWPAWIEALVVLACAVLGGFNDWNSVVHHRIYDYTVTVSYPELTTIPGWMLLFWGMILRFFFTLGRWRRLGPPQEPRNIVWLVGKRYELPWLKVVLELALILLTRQAIYRLYDDPFWSWIPFAAAIAAYAVLFQPGAQEWKIFAIMLVGGPIVEALYIQIGGLHRYHQGVFFGVPVWICLWWALSALIWSDLSFRAARRLATITYAKHTHSQPAL